MSQVERYDVAVIGGGSGGYATALRAAQLGLRTAIVEASKLGGTCLHRGCIPTKALLHAAEVADAIAGAGKLGLPASAGPVDLASLHAYKNKTIAGLHRGLEGLVAARGIVVVPGRGRLAAPDRVEVEAPDGGPALGLTADHIVLATGARPMTLPGLAVGGPVLTSDQALELDWLPAKAVIVGGGVIGVEFASLWRSLGVAVTIVEALPRLLASEDEAISLTLQRALRRRQIALRLGTAVAGLDHDGQTVTIDLADGEPLTADAVLVAVGRRPASDGLGLEGLGLAVTASGHIAVDDRLRTTVDSIRAVGDLVAGPQLAHRGYAHGLFVADDIAGLAPASPADWLMPRVTYASPEVAAVGLTEAQAREQHGEALRVSEYNLAGNGRSQILGGAGLIKVVALVDGPVLGVHLCGPGVSELAGQAQLACAEQLSPERLARLIQAHPTVGEGLGEAFAALAGRPLHGLG